MRRDLNGYRLDQLLGVGGTAEVWSAWPDAPDAEAVAIKRRRAGVGAASDGSLLAEAELLRAVRHPHLVPVLDVVADPPGVALVVPLLAGGSLRDLLDERGTLAAGEVVAVLGPIAAAVAALHRHGVSHGDLKPENVLLDAGGWPVLGDVGTAQPLGTPAGTARHATPAYLDPAV
ncbi:MAG TPA: protein kinase, partial [Aquihabitans sp.]|nr:protein kinase [Aquihabitans sp.]